MHLNEAMTSQSLLNNLFFERDTIGATLLGSTFDSLT